MRGRVFIDATGDADVVFHAGAGVGDGRRRAAAVPVDAVPACRTSICKRRWGAARPARREDRGGVSTTARYDLTRAGGAVIPTMRPGEFVGAMTRVARDGRIAARRHRRVRPDGRRDPRPRDRRGGRAVPGRRDARVRVRPSSQDTATTLGVRETRHALGDHVVDFDEAAACTKQPDGVAASDVAVRVPHRRRRHALGVPAGRRLVRDALPQPARGAASTTCSWPAGASRRRTRRSRRPRVTGACMAIGEGAGVAAAMAIAGRHRGPRGRRREAPGRTRVARFATLRDS